MNIWKQSFYLKIKLFIDCNWNYYCPNDKIKKSYLNKVFLRRQMWTLKKEQNSNQARAHSRKERRYHKEH